MSNPETILVNENGHPIGEHHPRSKVSNEDVERMRELRDYGASTAELAAMFSISEQQVRNICSYRSRNQVMVRSKRL